MDLGLKENAIVCEAYEDNLHSGAVSHSSHKHELGLISSLQALSTTYKGYYGNCTRQYRGVLHGAAIDVDLVNLRRILTVHKVLHCKLECLLLLYSRAAILAI
jgi:hypothetical protein